MTKSMRWSVTFPLSSEARELGLNPAVEKSSTLKRIERIITPISRRFRIKESENNFFLTETWTDGLSNTPKTCETNSGKQNGLTNLKQFKDEKKTVYRLWIEG